MGVGRARVALREKRGRVRCLLGAGRVLLLAAVTVARKSWQHAPCCPPPLRQLGGVEWCKGGTVLGWDLDVSGVSLDGRVWPKWVGLDTKHKTKKACVCQWSGAMGLIRKSWAGVGRADGKHCGNNRRQEADWGTPAGQETSQSPFLPQAVRRR